MKNWRQLDVSSANHKLVEDSYLAHVAYSKIEVALSGLQCGACTVSFAQNQLCLNFGNEKMITFWCGNKGELNSFTFLNWDNDDIANLLREALHLIPCQMSPAENLYWRYAAYWEIAQSLAMDGIMGFSLRHRPHLTCVRARCTRYNPEEVDSKRQTSRDEVVLVYKHERQVPSQVIYQLGPPSTMAKLKALVRAHQACRIPPIGGDSVDRCKEG